MHKSGNLRDIEGNEYVTSQIGNRIWMLSNLRTTRFQTGDYIPVIESNEEWEEYGEKEVPACCWYNNQAEGMARYGLLYNWFAVHDSRGLAPAGWSIPTEQDLKDLIASQGGPFIAGRKLKSRNGWSHFGSGNNSSGFSAQPTGGRGAMGSFLDFGDYANWWLRDTPSEREAYFLSLTFVDSNAQIQKDGFKASGLAVRCVRSL